MQVTLLGWQPKPWLTFSAYAISLFWSTMIKVWTLLPPFSFFNHVSSCSPPPDFYKTWINTMLGFKMWMDRALALEWNDSYANTSIQLLCNYSRSYSNSIPNPSYTIPYQFHNVPNSKQFQAIPFGKCLCNLFYSFTPYNNYFFKFSIGLSSSICLLIYLAFEVWTMGYTCTQWIGRRAQTRPVVELDGIIELQFHSLP